MLRAIVGSAAASEGSCVDRVGVEPTFCLGKNQVQSGFATDPCGPTLWNRTRTSRASAERADQLRKSGIRALRTCLKRARSAKIIIVIIFGCQRTVSAAGRCARKAHLGPRCIRVLHGRTPRDSRSAFRCRFAKSDFYSQSVRSERRPENIKGPLGCPEAALHAVERVVTLNACRTSLGTRISDRTAVANARTHLPRRAHGELQRLGGGFESVMWA